MTMGEFLRHERTRQALTLREVAHQVGVSAAFLSDVELGRRHPRPSTADRIAEALSLTPEDLARHDERARRGA